MAFAAVTITNISITKLQLFTLDIALMHPQQYQNSWQDAKSTREP